jgi:hypothetical protein
VPSIVTGGQPVGASIDAQRAQRVDQRADRPLAHMLVAIDDDVPSTRAAPPSGSASRCRHCRGRAARPAAQLARAGDDEGGLVGLVDRHAHGAQASAM